MSGIDRLRAIAGAWDEWGLGGTLAEIADEIERELVRQGEPDSTDNDARLLYVTDEDREALEWVRNYGGIGCVQTMAATLGDTLTWIRERAGISKYEVVDYDELLDAIDRRLMPEGMEWPRYESGEPVGFGDDVSRNGEDFEANVIALYRDGSFSLNFWAYSKGERVKRHAPKVLDADGVEILAGEMVYHIETGGEFTVIAVDAESGDVHVRWGYDFEDKTGTIDGSYLTHRAPVLAADGEPLEVGQTVWDVESWEELKVEKLCNVGLVQLLTRDGVSRYVYPDQLTHTKPEIDTWQRIEEDAGCTATKYNERRGTIFTTKQQVARDLVRRAKALSEREGGE